MSVRADVLDGHFALIAQQIKSCMAVILDVLPNGLTPIAETRS